MSKRTKIDGEEREKDILWIVVQQGVIVKTTFYKATYDAKTADDIYSWMHVRLAEAKVMLNESMLGTAKYRQLCHEMEIMFGFANLIGTPEEKEVFIRKHQSEFNDMVPYISAYEGLIRSWKQTLPRVDFCGYVIYVALVDELPSF